MKDQVVIRQAKIEDAPRTRELLLALLKNYPEAYLPTWEEEKKRNLEDEVVKLEELNQRPTSRLFVAETEGNLVGMVICHGHEKKRIRHQATVEVLVAAVSQDAGFLQTPAHLGAGLDLRGR